MELALRVLAAIRRHALVPPGGGVIVALSGGPDSVALVHLLLELQGRRELSVAGLAHLNHRLRGADADADEAFCRAMAASLGLPIEVERADVGAVAREQGRSVEDAARVVRYAFLEAARARLAADVVATGHSLDDQAETFLLRLIRGSGPRGLAGIRPRAGSVVRPLLEITRADLREYATERGFASREDASNTELSIPRNRVRHELIPYLEREFSPGIAAALAREAAIARDDEEFLEQRAIDLAGSNVLTIINVDGAVPPVVEVDAVALTSLHPALAARVARHALSLLAEGRHIGFDHVERLLHFARGDDPALSLPGQQAVRRGDTLVLGPAPSRARHKAQANSFRIPLSIPGEVRLDAQGWAISAERAASLDWPGGPGAGRAPSVAVAAAPLGLPLAIRSRRAGDRFRPLGMGHGKKLQDFMVDRKIPLDRRDSLPLVVDSHDRIVWVVGESVAEDFRVTEPAREVILLKARRLGGLG
ncbi:MAG: tRNA lysidine(34) synthetase TilS [Acidobacteriota bacterium]